MKTRDKILASSLQLFNDKGFVNITLRDISSELGISTGNLAYHFKNKDVIIESLYHQMIDELEETLKNSRMIPSFENIDRQMTVLLNFQLKYRFFFMDILEIVRAYPEIGAKYRESIGKQIDFTQAMFDYSVGVGNMHTASEIHNYKNLAFSVWIILSSWLSQAIVRNDSKHSFNKAKEIVWSLLLPHLTEKGRKSLANSFAFSYHID